jgi:ABC-type transport system substrate-binding protein
VASTAAIFSLISLTVGCDSGVKKQNKSLKTIKIGLQSDLLSFDPFSFQALGEKNITELLYDRLIYFENNQLKSDFKIVLSLKKNEVLIKNLDPLVRKKIKDIFTKSRSSVLWKEIFKPFDFKRMDNKLNKKNSSVAETYKIIYSGEKNFISNLKSLAPLLVVEGGPMGQYQIDSFQKGIKLGLIKNPNRKNSKVQVDKILLRKVKSISEGLKSVSQKEIDVFVPFHPSSKGDLEPYNKLLFVKSMNKSQKLRLYSKFGEHSPLQSIFCSNTKEIKKVLEKTWKLKTKSCSKKVKKTKPKNLNVIMSSNYGKQILDLLSQMYLKETGRSIEYEVLDGLKLSERLKSGKFDHYLSIDVESESLPVLFDSFHSKGRYNSLRIQDPKLDKLLQKASQATSIEEFNFLERKARARLKKVLPYIFEYSRPQTLYVVRKNNSLKFLKSSKTLMKFQK